MDVYFKILLKTRSIIYMYMYIFKKYKSAKLFSMYSTLCTEVLLRKSTEIPFHRLQYTIQIL